MRVTTFQQMYVSYIEIPHHVDNIFAKNDHVKGLLPRGLETGNGREQIVDSDIGHACSIR